MLSMYSTCLTKTEMEKFPLRSAFILSFDVMTLIKNARIVHNYTMPTKFSMRKIGACIYEAKYEAISR